jgi:hypothetical protein
VIVHVIAVGVMQVAIVEVIRVPVVLYRSVPAVRAMDVGMWHWLLLMGVGHNTILSEKQALCAQPGMTLRCIPGSIDSLNRT